MPDLKISQLNVASTPLAGTELVPIVQGGITEQTTVANFLSAGLPVSASTLSTTGNAGIGTSSPARKLDVRGVDNTDSIALTLAANTNGAYQGILFTAGAYAKAAIRAYSTGTTDAGSLTFWTSPVGDIPNLRATIDSSGNLGLGVTPSAWGGSYKAFENAAGFYGNFSTNVLIMGQNWYDSGAGSYLYKATGFASYYSQANGQHRFYNAPSGTAGNAISFTQAMTLDASGNLGVGTTAPGAKLHVATAGNNYIVSHNTAGSTSALLLGAESGLNAIYSWTTVAGSTGRPLAFFTGASEAMRLDTSGNLIQSAPTTPPTLSTNGTMVFNLTSNTNLRVSVRGSDGVTRVANITLA